MSNWKRALILGSLGAGAALALSGRRTAGAALAGVGVAVLASEHPEKVQQLWERAPEYMEKGTRIMNTVSRFLERLSEHQPRRIEPYVV